MSNHIIAIPTLGRINDQVTLNQLPDEWKKRTYLVCPPKEHGKHGHQTISCPESGIHNVREWIMQNIEATAIIQLDDDHPISYFHHFESVCYNPYVPGGRKPMGLA